MLHNLSTVWKCGVGVGVAIAVLFSAGAFLGDDASARTRPNVLFIAIDDLNCDVGCYGNQFVKTPNIDRLAKRGVRFDRADCQLALCNPSRTSLLSGRRPDATQIFDNKTRPRTTLGPVVFLPEAFRQNGYFTARVGKIAHGAFEKAVRWDVAEDFRELGRRRSPDVIQHASRPPNARPNLAAAFSWGESERKDSQHVDGQTALRIVELLRDHHDRPFFIAAGFHRPHLQWVVPRKYFRPYPASSVVLPQEPADVRSHIPSLALKTTRPDGAHLVGGTDARLGIAAYSASTSFADAQVGLLLDALDQLKLWENTIVVLWGDHGFHLGDHGGLWGKLTLFEQTARVPLIVAAPGKKAAVSPRLVELVDLYPTLIELCGLPANPELQGTSFAPLLANPDRQWKKGAFTQVLREQGMEALMGRSVRTERWRYTEWGGPEVSELYDHDVDPQELHNLSAEAAQRDTIAELHTLLHAGWQQAKP